MAWGNKKEERQIDPVEHATALVKAEMLQAEVNRLQAQVERLQEALVAASAPKAYESMQNAKNMVPDRVLTPLELEEEKKSRAEANFWSRHIEATEQPLFTDADEMISALGKFVGVNVGDEPIHPNSES